MRLTFFKNLEAREAELVDWSWEQLCEYVRDVPTYPNREAMPLIKLGVFGDVRSRKGSLRTNANLIAVSGLEGDYDGGVMPLSEAADRLAGAGVTALLYTSASHHPDRPRWRVLCPLSREYPPSARAGLLARVNGVLGGVLSPESFTPSQSYFIGRLAGSDYAIY